MDRAETVPMESAWKLGGLSIAQLGNRVWTDIGHNEILDRSAALSYYFIHPSPQNVACPVDLGPS